MKIFYIVLDGYISGGNHIGVTMMRAAFKAGHEVELLATGKGPLVDLLVTEGVTVHFIRLNRSYHLHDMLRLAYLLKKRRVDLVHTHTTLQGELLSRLACFLTGVPILCHRHDPIDDYSRKPLVAMYQKWVDRMTSEAVKHFIFVSRYRFESVMRANRYRPHRMKLIRNGIDVRRFSSENSRSQSRSELSLCEEHIAVGMIARLDLSKGQETLIEASRLVLKRHPQTKFFMIGDDHLPGQPCLNKYRRMVRDFGLEHSCFLLGFRLEIQKIIQGLDITVLPSWWESLPLVLLEAMASRKPVIASNVGGIPEIVTHMKEGQLIPPRDPASLAQAICWVIENPQLSDQMVMEGYRKVTTDFDERDMIHHTLSLYESVS